MASVQRPAEQLEPLISITGDSLDPSITISSRGVTVVTSSGLLASTTSENSWLRAFIDRKTGAITVQVYHSMTYGGRGSDTFARATYESEDGIKEVSVDQVGSDVSCSRYGCLHYADLVFPVSLDTLKQATKNFDPASPFVGLRYRIFGQSGAKIDEILPGNEIAAFVAVVNRESEKLKR